MSENLGPSGNLFDFGLSVSFDDVESALADAKSVLHGDGTLLRDALTFFDRLEFTTSPDGLAIGFTHSACGQNYMLTVSWVEALALASGLKPRIVYSSKLYPGGKPFAAQYPSVRANLGEWGDGPSIHTWSLFGMRCSYPTSPCRRHDMKVIVPSDEFVAAVEVAKRHDWIPRAALDWCAAYLSMRSRDYLVEVDETFWDEGGNWIP